MTMADEFIPTSTLGMLVESLRQLNTTTQKLDDTIEGLRRDTDDKLEKYVRKEVLDPQLETMREDIKKHASYWDWLVKIVGAIIVAAVLSLVIIQGHPHL